MAAPPAEVTIDIDDFGFGVSATMSPETQNVRVTNKGQQENEAFLIRLNPGASVDEFLDAFEPGAPPGPSPGQGRSGLQALKSGGKDATKDFTPGNHALVCFVEDPNTDARHFALGMIHEFTFQ